jgi:hypothetical protein
MELTELQNIWQQYDKKLSENTRLNKEILKMMLKSKPEKRVAWIKLTAAYRLLLPVVIILVMMVPRVEFRNEPGFYVGFLLFGPFAFLTYYWAIRYYLLVNKIDFSNSIAVIKKSIKEVEKYKIKMTKYGCILSPFGLTGVFLIANIPIFSKHSLLPFSLIISVVIISIYVTFKYSIYERFKKLNMEIDEIEQLEKE